MPSSVSEIKLPQTDILTISIAKDGKVFFNLDGKYTRQSLIERMGQQYGIQFTENEVARFAVMSSSFGVPIQNLREVLAMNSEERANLEQPGIPIDSLNNQLRDWIIFSRISNPRLRVAIKGDQDSNYPVIEKVMNTLIDNNVNRFNLITNLETGS
jgi:biopolymer transport protein ExbD